ncbi:MAG: PGF-pre-PGF domain-containing protein, partial [Candidatus Aenigmarchaeota archaeon]|nr:PGF-pre-PGF domain-containing protein [Candidatus Aenigmarchaeota archaeon]
DSSTGSSVSDSKQSGLRVLSPASLSVTSSIVAGSVLFTVGVNNVGDTATTFDLSVNCPAGVTCSTTSETGVAIGGNSLVTRTITTDGPAGTYVVTATITPAGQAPTTTSQTVTFEAAATTAAAAAAAGAGGTKTAGQPNATKEIPSIAAGKSAVVTIEKTENVVLRSIEITVINSANNVKVTVIKLADKPAIVTQDVSGTVYHFIQVDKIGLTDTNVAKAKVKFAVEKSWISANKIDPMTVALQRYQQSGWNKLATVKVGETADEIEYEAESPGLSVFAVTGQPIIPSQPPTEEQKKEAAATTPTSYGSSLMGILVIIAIVAAAVYYNKNRGRKRTSALKASR